MARVGMAGISGVKYRSPILLENGKSPQITGKLSINIYLKVSKERTFPKTNCGFNMRFMTISSTDLPK